MVYKSSEKIKGTALLLKIGEKDHWADCTECTLSSAKADKDSVTFADAANGASAAYSFKIKAVQSTDPSSLWTFIWEHSGETVPFVFAPHGNDTPSASKPHFTGKLTIPEKPSIGGAAGDKPYDFDSEMHIEGTPEKVTTGPKVEGAGMASTTSHLES